RVVGCLSENTIQDLVAGALSGDARAKAHRHIEICAACRTLVIELARDGDLEVVSHLGEQLTNDMSVDTPPSVVAHIEHAIPAYGLAEPGAVFGPYRIVRWVG